MIGNGGGYYRSPYGSAPFPTSNNYRLTPPNIPPLYNPAYQQQQPQQKSPVQSLPLSFKLYDLDTHGQSEILRLIFAYVGVSYKDKRLKQEEWEKIKTQMSFDQLPILRVNNQFKIFHLQAIIRYLAREFHLYGTSKHDHAIVDIILECIRPLQEKIIEQLINSTDHEQAFKQLITDHLDYYLKQLEKFYDIFNRNGPFYLGTSISIADLVIYDIVNYLLPFDSKLLDNYPDLKVARRRLEKHPKILDYINRKTTNQNKQTPEPQRHQTKSPTPNFSHRHHHHHHHHRHRSHDEHHLNHHYHRYHHHHHHHRPHSKEPTPLSQTKRSSKSPSISKKDKEPTDIIPPPPPIPTATTESTVN